jgi:signal peptidase I
VGLIIFQSKIFEPEAKDVFYGRVEFHHRKRIGFPGELQLRLFEMVVVQMNVSERVDELAGLEIAYLGDHQGQQGVGRYIKGNAEEDVGAALIKLTAQSGLAIGVARYIKLEKSVTRHQCHLRQIGHIPGADDQSAAVGRLFYLRDQLGDLVDGLAISAIPATPLFAIDGSELAVCIGPFVPDGYAMVVQVFDIRLAAQEPEQFIDDAFEMQLFGRDQGKSFRQVETNLVAEDAEGSRSGTIRFFCAGVEDMLEKIVVLLHVCKVQPAAGIIFGERFEFSTRLHYFTHIANGRRVRPDTSLNLVYLKLLRVNNFSSEPSLRPGRFFLTARVRKPRRFDLISYRAILPLKGPTILTHRLCGMPGDMLEIKAGVLFVNGQDVDHELALKHIFKIAAQDCAGLVYDRKQSYTIPPYTNTLYVSLDDIYVRKLAGSYERYVLPAGLRDEEIFLAFKKNWNRDNFGPIRVPEGRWFVLGDNRGNSRDSRYLGLVEQSRFVGTVIWK